MLNVNFYIRAIFGAKIGYFDEILFPP